MSSPVECGCTDVLTGEIPVTGRDVSLHESPCAHTRRGCRDETPLSAPCLGRHQFEPAGGGCEVFAVGERVVLIRPRGADDLRRVWTVAECRCDLCRAGLVALNEWIAPVGWRHVTPRALRRYGHPRASELQPRSPVT